MFEFWYFLKIMTIIHLYNSCKTFSKCNATSLKSWLLSSIFKKKKMKYMELIKTLLVSEIIVTFYCLDFFFFLNLGFQGWILSARNLLARKVIVRGSPPQCCWQKRFRWRHKVQISHVRCGKPLQSSHIPLKWDWTLDLDELISGDNIRFTKGNEGLF